MFESINAPTRPNWMLRIAAAVIVVAVGAACVSLSRMTQMPLRSYKGPLPPLTAAQAVIRDHMAAHVRRLSTTIGERNVQHEASLRAAADYLHDELVQAGYAVAEQTYAVEGREACNLECPRPQRGSRKILMFGDQNVRPANRLLLPLFWLAPSLYFARPSMPETVAS